MTKFFLYGVFIGGLSIAACSEPTALAESAPQAEAASTPAQTGTTAQGVISQGQLDAMAKAAATSSVLEQAEQERRKQMEAQGL